MEKSQADPITWNDIAQMLVYSDQAEALAEADAAIAFALPGYKWKVAQSGLDPLDRSKLDLHAFPENTTGEVLCPEQVRDAVWDHNSDAPDPVTPFVKAYRLYRKAQEPKTEDMGEVSDGYHTFNELYEHRHALFLALAATMPDKAWASRDHADGTAMDGWFIAGIQLDGFEEWRDKTDPLGQRSVKQITYHLPDRLWEAVEAIGIGTQWPPSWDGHTSNDVVARLTAWAKRQGGPGQATGAVPEDKPVSLADVVERLREWRAGAEIPLKVTAGGIPEEVPPKLGTRYRFVYESEINRYTIHAREGTTNRRSYLGAQASRIEGGVRDLADGEMMESTWRRIRQDIEDFENRTGRFTPQPEGPGGQTEGD